MVERSKTVPRWPALLVEMDCYALGSITCGNDVSYLGGLCGQNSWGLVENCHASVNIAGGDRSQGLGGLCGMFYGDTLRNSYASGSVSGGSNSEYLGGLIGLDLGGSASGCWATGEITGGVSSNYLGGLCGCSINVTIMDCYATGNVTSGDGSDSLGGLCGMIYGETISQCYSTGRVMGGDGLENVGGLCGNAYTDSIIRNCFWDVEASGMTTSAGGEGKTTAEMKAIAIFTSAGWDFVGEVANGTTDVWRMCADGVDYPRLSWEFAGGGDFACPDGVTMEDLLYLAGRWVANTPETIGAADADGDGKVDLSDFVILASNWMRLQEQRSPISI
jgi:hypothetical protein